MNPIDSELSVKARPEAAKAAEMEAAAPDPEDAKAILASNVLGAADAAEKGKLVSPKLKRTE